MPIKRIDELPEGSGSLSNDDIFLFMDDPSGSGVTKKISLSDIGAVIGGGGGNSNTGDIIFNDSTISTSDENGNINITAGTDGTINLNSNEKTWGFNSDGTVSLPINTPSLPYPVLDGGDNSVDIKSSRWVELWYSSEPSGTPNNWIENPSFNTDTWAWVDQYGVYFTLQREDDGTNPSWLRTWEFASDGNSQFPGNILFPNGTSVATGTFDNGTGGQNGISLNCAVGYELNWQGGRLKSTYNNGESAAPIFVDSPMSAPPVVLESASNSNTINTNAKDGDIFDITLTENSTLANPTNPVNGKTIRWRITQDATGNRTVTLGSKFNLPSSATSPLPWSSGVNKMDILAATYHEGRDKWDVVAFVPGY